jgi:hypothetical protein
VVEIMSFSSPVAAAGWTSGVAFDSKADPVFRRQQAKAMPARQATPAVPKH